MAADRDAHTLDLRFYPPFLSSSRSYAGLYLAGTIGWSWYESSSLQSTRSPRILSEDGFSQSMGTAGWAIGYSMPSAYIEVYSDYGLEKLELPVDSGDGIAVPVSNPGFRWGFYFEL